MSIPIINKSFEPAKQKLKAKGFKLTSARLVILQFVLNQKGHLTAENIYQKLRRKGLGRSTVFRTLKILKETDLLEQKYIDTSKNYELKEKTPHFHTICRQCGNVTEFKNNKIIEICTKEIKKNKFKMEKISLEILGICNLCKKK